MLKGCTLDPPAASCRCLHGDVGQEQIRELEGVVEGVCCFPTCLP